MERFDEAAKAERRAYFKEWRAKNPDKVRQHNATYWKKRAERKALTAAEKTQEEVQP